MEKPQCRELNLPKRIIANGRINEHVTNIKNGFRKHSVSNHFRIYHQQNPVVLKFYGIDKVLPCWRGGDMITQVS